MRTEQDEPQTEPPLADLDETVTVWCPYCGEEVEMLIDPGGGASQEYVEDCEVCCRPWEVRVAMGQDGIPMVDVTTLDEP